MTPGGYGGRLNLAHFGGRLSPPVLRHFASIGRAGAEARQFVERLCAQFAARGIPAEDFSTFLAWSAATYVPRLMPAAWRGVAPPITVAGRHRRIDEYLARNRWHSIRAGDRILDLGCGFPPVTTAELAARFPRAWVTGADPVAGSYLIRLANGDVACFTGDLSLLYFQPGSNSDRRWQAMYASRAATRARFLARLRPAIDRLSADRTVPGFIRLGATEVWRHPGLGATNLEILQAGIGSRHLGRFRVIRAMNVLPYFDRPRRRRAMRWVRDRLENGGIVIAGVDGPDTRHARYRVDQRVGDRLVLREFAMSLDQIRPLEVTAFFALHDDDPDLPVFDAAVRAIRSDASWLARFDRRMDALLGNERFCRRTARGYLGGTPGRGATGRLGVVAQRIDRVLVKEGFVAGAARALRMQGYDAWINSAGHLAFRPA